MKATKMKTTKTADCRQTQTDPWMGAGGSKVASKAPSTEWVRAQSAFVKYQGSNSLSAIGLKLCDILHGLPGAWE